MIQLLIVYTAQQIIAKCCRLKQVSVPPAVYFLFLAGQWDLHFVVWNIHVIFGPVTCKYKQCASIQCRRPGLLALDPPESPFPLP